jgi:stage II sporulation protein D
VANPYPVYIFNGSGWGHGVGMSQWGAYGMAKQGYSYREILNYYYSNVQIEQKE